MKNCKIKDSWEDHTLHITLRILKDSDCPESLSHLVLKCHESLTDVSFEDGASIKPKDYYWDNNSEDRPITNQNNSIALLTRFEITGLSASYPNPKILDCTKFNKNEDILPLTSTHNPRIKDTELHEFQPTPPQKEKKVNMNKDILDDSHSLSTHSYSDDI